MIMDNDRGSISLMAVIMVFAASLLAAAMGQLNKMEHRAVEASIVSNELRIMAETAAEREYEKIHLDNELLRDILTEGRKMKPLGETVENEKGRCQVFVGEGNSQVIIWAVAEKDSSKAQVCYILVFDEDTDRFVLKGCFY